MRNLFKTFIQLAGVSLVVSLISCSKSDNDSKVNVAEGYIALTQGDSTISYKIEEISYLIANDTTSLEIIALQNNSTTNYIVVGLRNIVALGEHKYNISRMFETEPDSSSAYLYFLNNSNSQTQTIDQGELTVLKYQYNNVFQANFSYTIFENNDTISVKGEINLNFAHYDPSRIPNVPISPGKLRINVDSAQQTFSCVASYIASTNQYVINGVKNNATLVIEVKDVDLLFNKTYPIGQAIDSTGFIKLTYTDSTGTFLCDGKNSTSGKLTIAKITFNTFQGYLEGKAYQSKTKQSINFTDGIFFAKLKRINQ
ncbi:MAG: DUF6252 family protein [Bacteroidales bacterium]